MHAVEVARELDMPSILIPPAPGILCAEGVAAADLEEAFVATCRTPLSGSLELVSTSTAKLLQEADTWFEAEQVAASLRNKSLAFDMRYIGQNFELTVPRDELENNFLDPASLRSDFLEAHKTKYGHADPEAAIEIVNVRVVARQLRPPTLRSSRSDGEEPPHQRQSAPTTSGSTLTNPTNPQSSDRATLHEGTTIDTPSVISQFDATTLLHQDTASVLSPAAAC